jgi:hypothetical protein
MREEGGKVPVCGHGGAVFACFPMLAPDFATCNKALGSLEAFDKVVRRNVRPGRSMIEA